MDWQRFGAPMRALVAFLCVLASGTAAAAPGPMAEELRNAMQAAFDGEADAAGSERPFSMVIRGGVSLGAYEAGVNWAVLRLLKDLRQDAGARIAPELYAAAGASAGAVNGFLAGLLWCTEEAAGLPVTDTMQDNLFFNTWRTIDVNALLKHEPLNLQRAEDRAGFSRAAMRVVQNAVLGDIRNRRFRPGCEVGFGVSLTRDKPVLFTNAGVDIGQQRLLLPMRLSGNDDYALEIRHFDDITPPDFDDPDAEALRERSFRSSVIYLDDGRSREIERGLLSPEAVFDAIKASSAFPVAFSPMKLSYCLFQNERQRTVARQKRQRLGAAPERRDRCPDNYRRLSSRFVDGGVFDNDPVQLVRELTELRNAQDGRRVRYVKVDPDKRRPRRDQFRFEVAQLAQPGDSLDIVLWAARPTLSDEDPPRTKILVRQCHAPGSADRRYTDHPLELVENAPNSLLFVGTIDTRPVSGELARVLAGDGVIPVTPLDRLVPYHPDEVYRPTCSGDPAPAVAGLDETAARAALQAHNAAQQKTLQRSVGVVAEAPQGLSTQLGFLGGSVSSARGYRLYDELMRNDWRDGIAPGLPPDALPMLQPTRLTPVTGDFLFAFAAFFDERFRDFDYYAGIYDAVYGAAELTCLARPGTQPTLHACRAHRARLAYLQLCAPGDASIERCRRSAPAANVVVHHLARLEQCGVEAAIDPGADCKLEEWDWTRALLPADAGAHGELAAIGRALQGAIARTQDSGRDPFVRFVKNLAAPDSGFSKGQSAVLDRMLALSGRPVPTWFYPVAESMVPQLIALERNDKEIRDSVGIETAPGRELLLPTLAIGGLAAETVMAERTGWLPDQTAVPEKADRRWLASVVPAEVAVDARNGGAAFYLNPAWRFSSGNYEIDFRIAPWLSQRFDNETIEFSEASALFTRRLTNPLFSSVGFGPTYTYTWEASPAAKEHNVGATLSAGLAADKIRLSYGVRSFSSSEFSGDDQFFHIGINDLPGIVYWACQGNDGVRFLSWACGVFD